MKIYRCIDIRTDVLTDLSACFSDSVTGQVEIRRESRIDVLTDLSAGLCHGTGREM